MSTRMQTLLYVLLLFAAVGFLNALFMNPLHLLAVIGGTALVLFLAHTYLKTGRILPRFSKGTQPPKKRTQPGRPAKKKGSAARKRHPFHVIEGNKGKSPKQPEQEQRLP